MASVPVTESAYSGLPAVQQVPTNILSSGLLSPTSSALECFVDQRFSSQMQAFLISYSNSINANYPILAT